MKNLTKFVLIRPITTIMVVLCLIVFGYSSVTSSKLELTPDMEMSMMIVMTTYTGANPEDVDQLITKEIEDSIGTLSGIKSINSSSSEGSSMIMLEYDYGTDMDEAYDSLKQKLDTVAMKLPEDVDTPMVLKMNSNSSADMSLAVNKEGEDNLYNYVNDKIVPEFEKISDVAEVTAMGGSEAYIKVEIIPEKLEQYGITMSSIANDIADADKQIPAGDTDVGNWELSVSTRTEFDTIESLSAIPLTTTKGNNIIYLDDVAYIYTAENADSIIESLQSVAETLILAIIISMTILWLFFGDIKASLIVGSSIPVSILTALILMNLMGFSLNVITLSALTLGVGMMVDNSIVVLESCFRVTSAGKSDFIDYAQDALTGTGIVSASILGGTLTTCVVFLPLAFLEGMTGQLFKPLGFTIVFCLSASLISALTIVPLCYMFYKPVEKSKALLSRPVRNLQSTYRRVMYVLLPKKKTVMFTSIALLVFSFFLAGKLKMELMASDDQGRISISIETRPGMKSSETDKILKEVEAIVAQCKDVETYSASSGGGGVRGSSSSVNVNLKSDREMETQEVVDMWKEAFSDITNCDISVESSSSMSMMSSFGDTYELILKSTDYDELKETTSEIASLLMERDDITRVHTTLENSAPVIEISVDPVEAKAAGITTSEIGSTINAMLSGIEATTIETDGIEQSVMVEYSDDMYTNLEEIKNITLNTSSGGSVALTDVADISFVDTPASITREDKEYKVTISAEYNENATETSSSEIMQDIVSPNLTSTVTTGMNSMDRSMNEEFASLFTAIATAVFLIFVVMAAQFESPRFSFMVMTTIPFSLIGAFGLLFLADSAISMTSLLGFLMLIGTVVNSGILYVDTVNQYRSEGMDMDNALIEAGATRLRPILMTTLTTIISMIPMALALGNSGSMTQGLALVNIGGLTASTFLSLLMLPVYYSIMSRKKPKKERVMRQKRAQTEKKEN